MRRPFSDSSPRIPPIHRCFCLLCHEKRSLLLRVYATVQINANITTYPLCKQLFLFASQDYAHNMSYIPLQLLWQVSRILTPMPSGWAISLTGSASIASTTGKLLLELYQSHASLRDVSRFQIGWIFGKVQNGLWPPPSFSESYIALFATKLGQKCICSYEGTVVYYMILFPMRCMFNMVIGWKHTLKRPFYIIFMLKKPCLKVQILQYKFLDWKWPPPLSELFRKFIRSVNLTRP